MAREIIKQLFHNVDDTTTFHSVLITTKAKYE